MQTPVVWQLWRHRPMPLGNLRQALADILLVTPLEFKQHVDRVAAETVETFGFSTHYSFRTRRPRPSGRTLFHRAEKLAAPASGGMGRDPRRDRRCAGRRGERPLADGRVHDG
ncbi:hypothetical protein AGR9A_Cc140055 [Agrobacterium salinitolerans str. Hayward 0363]|nr:hypothetical protein AGR9A_Cc140055 [Agrobacterium salinitolerans str. Hayward 0363]